MFFSLQGDGRDIECQGSFFESKISIYGWKAFLGKNLSFCLGKSRDGRFSLGWTK